MGIGSLRQGAQKVSQNNSNKGGSGGKGGFFNTLRITKLTPALQGMLRPNEPAGDPIMLVRPEVPYDDVYDIDEQGNWKGTKGDAHHHLSHEFKFFKDGKERFGDFICTAGPNPHAPQPCVGCSVSDSGNKAIGNSRQKWGFNVKHLVAYHEVPLLDRKTGQIKYKNDKPGEPIMVLEACRNGSPGERLYAATNRKSCEYCQRNLPQTYGAPKVWVLGKGHLEELLKVDTHLEQTCANCMTRLLKVAFACVQCGNDTLDLATQTQATNEQIQHYASNPQQCGHCHFVGIPKPVYECGFDPNGMYKVPNGCPDNVTPKPLSIFDCVFYVHKEGEGTQTKVIVSPPIPIQHFRTLTGQADLLSWLKQPHLQRTFNLIDMFKSVSLDEQAKLCGVPNPYAAQQPPQFQQYPQGAPQQQGFAPGQQAFGGPPQAPQQYGQPAPQQFGVQQPGYPPQNPQWSQNNGPQVPQPGMGNQPQFPQPGQPFSGRPDFGK